MLSSVTKDKILCKVSKINSHEGGLNVVRSKKYVAHIIFIPNLTTDKKVGSMGESWGKLMHPNVHATICNKL